MPFLSSRLSAPESPGGSDSFSRLSTRMGINPIFFPDFFKLLGVRIPDRLEVSSKDWLIMSFLCIGIWALNANVLIFLKSSANSALNLWLAAEECSANYYSAVRDSLSLRVIISVYSPYFLLSWYISWMYSSAISWFWRAYVSTILSFCRKDYMNLLFWAETSTVGSARITCNFLLLVLKRGYFISETLFVNPVFSSFL